MTKSRVARLLLVAFGIAVGTPATLHFISTTAHAAGYMLASGIVDAPCPPGDQQNCDYNQ